MAFGHVGGLGTAQVKVAAATISMSPTSNVPVGDIVVVMCSIDATHISGGATIDDDQVACFDSVGNLYYSPVSGQSGGGSGSGFPEGAIFIAVLQVALTTTDTITVQHNSTTNRVAKTMSAEQFTTTTGKVALYKRTGRTDNSGTDPGAMTLSPLVSREYLLLHVLCSAGIPTDAYTEDADYTSITSVGTTGGVDTTNETVFGGWRIATLTTDTVDVTEVPARQTYQGYVAVYEYTDALSFPQTPLRDDFNRADEAPLADPWNTVHFPAQSGKYLALVSNEVTAQAASTDQAGQYWGTNSPTQSQEAWATLTVAQTTAGDDVAVLCNCSPGGASVYRGWRAQWELNAHGAGIDPIILGHTGSLGGGHVGFVWKPLTTGVKWGIRYIPPVVSYWIDIGAGWVWVAAFDSNADSGAGVVGSSGTIALQMQRTVSRVDDFGGGIIPPVIVGHFLPYLGVGA